MVSIIFIWNDFSVCTRWNSISELYWSEPKLTIIFNVESTHNRKTLTVLTCEDFQQILDITGTSLSTLTLDNNFLEEYSKLITLQFSCDKYELVGCTVSQVLELLSTYCHHVKYLGIWLTKSFPLDVLYKFILRNDTIEELIIDGNCQCYLDDLDTIDNLMKSLKRLKLICCLGMRRRSLPMVRNLTCSRLFSTFHMNECLMNIFIAGIRKAARLGRTEYHWWELDQWELHQSYDNTFETIEKVAVAESDYINAFYDRFGTAFAIYTSRGAKLKGLRIRIEQ